MNIVAIIIVLVIVGVVLWGLNQFPGIDETYRKFIRVVVIGATVIWLVLQLAPVLKSLTAT